MQFRHSVGISGQVKRLICLCVYCLAALEIKLRDLCLLGEHATTIDEREYASLPLHQTVVLLFLQT